MKSLLLYYSNSQGIRDLCEASARDGKVDVIELRERYDRGVFWTSTVGLYKALSGTGSRIDDIDVDLNDYDSIILATPVWGFNPAPAINEFLHRTNLSGREVSGLLIHPGKSAGMAGDVLRKRIRLAGGVCRGIVSIPMKELKERNCDVCSLASLKTQTAI